MLSTELSRLVKRASAIPTSLLLVVLLGVAAAILPLVTRAAFDYTPLPQTDEKKKLPEFIPGEIVVRFRPEAAIADATKVRERSSLFIPEGARQIEVQVERLSVGPEIVEGLRLARVAEGDQGVALASLRARPDVLYAEPNYIRRKQATPNDPLYPNLWGLKNTGQLGGLVGADINAEEAWNITTGSRDVVVAVIDEGIDINHPDLQANIWRNAGEIPGNGIDDDGNGFVDDVNGYDFFHNDGSVYDGPGENPDGSLIDAHGTHVAGTIGATGNNGIGVVGVNWQVSLMALKFLGPRGGSTADLVKALGYAKMMRDRWVSSGGTAGANVRITNNSYGGGNYSQAEFDAILALRESDILFVASAGNNSKDNDSIPHYPASYDLPNVISVAATNRFNLLEGLSNRGSRTVHVGAPGAGIQSTTPQGTYAVFSGTSMASAHASGVAALALAAFPNLTMTRLRAAVLFNGPPVPALTHTTTTGLLVSAAGAIQLASQNDITPPGTVTDFRVLSQNDRVVTLTWTAPGDDGFNGRASQYEIRFVNPVSGATFRLSAPRPAAAGSVELEEVIVPYRHPNGIITLLVTDKAGHTSTASVAVSISEDAADPYIFTDGTSEVLSTGGNLIFNSSHDDMLVVDVLPFQFPFFEGFVNQPILSTNGAIYFPPASPGHYDLTSSASRLASFPMIAGLWDDLDLRTSKRSDGGIYRVQPDANRVIFRWQGVPCNFNEATNECAGGGPVNFEIELTRDGRITMRYGDGNTQLRPVVGIGGGEADAYSVASHTSEIELKNLTNASTLNFSLRQLPKQADLKILGSTAPNPAVIGSDVTYTVTVTNAGPDAALGVSVTSNLAPEFSYLNCSVSQGNCTGPAQGTSGAQIVASLGRLEAGASATLSIVATVSSTLSSFSSNATVSSLTYDPQPETNHTSTFTSIYEPNPNPMTGVSQVAAGERHSLALLLDGTVVAWGDNFMGQLGSGAVSSQTPSWVNGLGIVKTVAAGTLHSIAIKANGNLWTWGANSNGQLGDGSTTSRSEPRVVPGISDVRTVAGGGGHTIAQKGDGTVWVWGANGMGQVGDGTTTSRLAPVQVPELSAVTSVAAGFQHSVAVRSDGTVWAWGDNTQGQLGDGTVVNRLVPTRVDGLSGIKAVAANGYFTLALRSDGTVWAWGSNGAGQLGDGTRTSRSSPVLVSGLTGVTAITAGSVHSVALRDDGSIWAWGSNNHGQLGIGFTNLGQDALTPVRTIILTNAKAIAAGGSNSLGLAVDATLYSWGASSRSFPYQISPAIERPTLPSVSIDPEGGTYSSPQAVNLSLPGGFASLKAISFGGFSMALLDDGSVYAWGSNNQGQLGVSGGPNHYSTVPIQVSGVNEVIEIAAAASHGVALKADGTVWTWGANLVGQLGDGTTVTRHSPALVVGLTNITAIAAGASHTLALRSDGTVWAWGSNNDGTLGDGSQLTRTSPVQVVGLSDIKAIGAADQHSLAVKTDGTVWTWGSNLTGQLGTGTVGLSSSTPVQATGLTNVVAVTGGALHSLALRDDGTVWSWGSNQFGALGEGPIEVRSVPTMIQSLTDVTAVAAGNDNSMALKMDGTVWIWGRNNFGQLGVGNHVVMTTTPIQLNLNVNKIGFGGAHAGALASDGALWMWGLNNFGQLGDGSTFDRYIPIQLTFFASAPNIHYTINGAEPTDDDPVISSGSLLLIDRSMVLKARAFRNGFAPGSIKTANFTINLANPTDDSGSFVRQHYLDFLNREPDAGGLAFWTNEIASCNALLQCIELKRINVSAAFFLSIEFQQTGYLVYRIHKAAFGNPPEAPVPIRMQEFLVDTQTIAQGVVVGQAGWEETLESNKQAFAAAFVNRPTFLDLYPTTMSPEEFIEKLYAKTGVTPSTQERQVAIEEFGEASTIADSSARARALRRVAENSVFAQQEFNRAFVLMQYFGYLRRNPDDAPDTNFDGYNFWLNKLNQFNGNFVNAEMVKAFIVSGEYRQRFGP